MVQTAHLAPTGINMRSAMIMALAINIFLAEGKMLKVFDFYGHGILKTEENTLDFVQLDNDAGRNLPSKFTICVSNFQEKFSSKQILQFLDKRDQPWFYIYFDTFNQDEIGEVRFWMDFDGEFLNFGSVKGLICILQHFPIFNPFRGDETTILVPQLHDYRF